MFLVLVDCGISGLFHCSLSWFCGSRENCLLLCTFLIVRTWASCSDRLFILGDMGAILVYRYPQIYYQWQYLSYFDFLLQTAPCASDCVLLIRRLFFFPPPSVSVNEISCVYAFKNCALCLYWSFKVSSTFL